jgi:ABC-2 type transport system ATP-binding protein
MAGTTNVIEVRNVSKHFVIRKEKSLKERVLNPALSRRHREEFRALDGVDLTVTAGSTVGLVGPNGSGKSTLLKTIGGIIHPTTGEVLLRGRLAALLELGAGFHPDLTGRENVFLNASILGLSRQFTERNFDAIVEFSGIEDFIDTQVKFYSSGMYVRLAFAVAVHVDPDILLVDEVLAVGDEPFQRKCLDRIRTFQKEGRTIILVSHGMDQVAEFCDRVVVLEHGRVVADGDPQDALSVLRADFDETRRAELERQREHQAQDLPHARFIGVGATTLADQSLRPVVGPGETLTIAMEIVADEEVRDWTLGVGITTPIGTGLFQTTNDMLGVHLEPLRGHHRFVLDLPHLALGDGDYTVATSLYDANGRELHAVPNACQFSVRTAATSRGPVAMTAKLMQTQ